MDVYMLFMLALVDCIVIRELRSFLWDFLMIRNTRDRMKRNLMKQSRKDRITLSYIEPLLKKNQKPFRWWHGLYLCVIYSLIPQYVFVFIIGIVFTKWYVSTVILFGIIKILIYYAVRINMDASSVSKYSKYYQQYKKNKK